MDEFVCQQLAVDEVTRRNIASLFLPIGPANPCLVLHISRENLVPDTIQQLTNHAVTDLKKPLKVVTVLSVGSVRLGHLVLNDYQVI